MISIKKVQLNNIEAVEIKIKKVCVVWIAKSLMAQSCKKLKRYLIKKVKVEEAAI